MLCHRARQRYGAESSSHEVDSTVQSCLFSDNNQKCVLCSDKNAIRFIPRENGVHSIDVKFNGCHIPGSPFNVRVGDPGLIGDPGMVTAHGAGLQGGTTGIAALP